MHKIVKKLLITAGILGLALTGITAINTNTTHASTDTRMAPINNQVKIKNSRNANNYWKARVGAYANARAQYYYPHVTYNTRALTALPTANYKYAIKPDKLYRSANLHFLDARGAKLLKRQHIHQDIDLRAWSGPNNSITAKPQPGEKRNGIPDKYKIHMHYHYIPIETSREEALSWPYRKHYGEAYRFSYWYALSNNARKAYHNALMFMYHNHHGAIMYNCTQGRDRTGTLSILLENILGISKFNIYNDFLLTNYYKRQSSYTNQLERIDTFYRAINRTYGSMRNYERRGLRLSNRVENGLRRKFLHRIYIGDETSETTSKA